MLLDNVRQTYSEYRQCTMRIHWEKKSHTKRSIGGGDANREEYSVLWRACNLTSFSPCLTGRVDYPFASRHKGPGFKSPGGYLCETGILLLALSRYIGDPDVIDHCGLIWGRLRPKLSLGHQADNVKIPLDLTQLFCPGFTLAAGPPSSFTTDIVGSWGGALWGACNFTSFSPCLTCPVDYPFASRHKGPGFKSPGGYSCETEILLLALSCYSMKEQGKKVILLRRC
jgi:hypothetical protein